MTSILSILQVFSQILTAGIAVTAFSLLLYALTFNLRDRVARSFAIILLSLVIVYSGEALSSATSDAAIAELWLRFQWVGLVFLPAAYLQLSDALLATTGRPSRGRRRLLVRLMYLISLSFLITLAFSILVGPLELDGNGLYNLRPTGLSWVFTGYYAIGMIWSWVNFFRAYRRTITSTSRRRMRYLLSGALAPALGSFPYLLFGAQFARSHQSLFWLVVIGGNIAVSVLLIIMAYAVAFFGVSWPDRVVKRRLAKWLMRGPVTASTVLAVTTIVRRTGRSVGIPDSAVVPVAMVVTILLMEHWISLFSPLWERFLFYGRDQTDLRLLQTMEDRLLTTGDLRQFLEALLAAVCDQFQVTTAFVASLGAQGIDLVVTMGHDPGFTEGDLSEKVLEAVSSNNGSDGLFTWGNYWLYPLSHQGDGHLIGLLGVKRRMDEVLEKERWHTLSILGEKAALVLEDRLVQQEVFISLKSLSPQSEMIQRLRAASRYDVGGMLIAPEALPDEVDIAKAVKDALSHYWGGPKLTMSPLMRLRVVQSALEEHEGNTVNALRSILRQAIEQVRPEGERRFTGEWILYNILEMKFMEGRKVREVALRLAMSEADLYRKQRVAIEAVAHAIQDMERQAQEITSDSSGTKLQFLDPSDGA